MVTSEEGSEEGGGGPEGGSGEEGGRAGGGGLLEELRVSGDDYDILPRPCPTKSVNIRLRQ